MLSRVAETMYWFGRLVERSGHVAQLADVHLNLWLDSGQGESEAAADYWSRFLALCADPVAYEQTGLPVDASSVADYVISDQHPGGILASLDAAREGARSVRESISTEVWEGINTLYWQVQNARRERTWATNPHAFLQPIKTSLSLLYGMIDETMLHDEGWSFLGFGRYFERAMDTLHLLDLKYRWLWSPETVTDEASGPIDPLQWAAILRCCWAFEPYRRHYATAVRPTRVAEFLLLNPEFPRSVSFAIRQARDLIQRIDLSSRPANQTERWLGTLAARLEYATIEEIVAEGLPQTLAFLQERCAAVEQTLLRQHFQGFSGSVPEPIVQPSGYSQQQ